MRVFVTGATGAIGGHVVPALLEAGHEVTALARTDQKAAELAERGATAAVVSLFDRDALAEAFAGHDAVANLATAIPPPERFLSARAWRDNDRVRIQGSTAVVDAARSAGVGVLVQESISMFYPDRGACWIDEDVAPEPFPVARSNLAAEENARRFAAAGGAGIVLRFGLFYGSGAAHSEQLLALARRGVAAVMGSPEGYVSSIHLADAAGAVVAALHAPSGTYNVVDDEPLTKRQYARALEAAVGRSAWLRAPGRAAGLLGDRVAAQTRSMRVANTRFRAATGWVPRYPSAREGWQAAARGLDRPA